MTYSNATIEIAQATAPFFWGVDIGGTGIKLALVDDSGHVVSFTNLPTRQSEGADAAMDQIAEVIQKTEDSLGVRGLRIGLGAPGPMDLPNGLLVSPPQLPAWWGYKIVDAVETRTNRPVSFLNDANAAAYGEFWLGSGRAESSMLLLTLGTGVGGGIIVDDELINGVNSCGSECGHMIVDPAPTARLCVWGGGRGHLEAYASASGVVQRTRELLTQGAQSALTGLLGGENSELTAKKVYEAALDGDALSLQVVDETARWLGVGITTLVHTIDPGTVVLGGAMTFGGPNCKIGQRFLAGISEEFRSRTFENIFAGTHIKFATLGPEAGYLGLAGYARKEHAQD
ncbi:ROK family protein [Rubripirellula amarantea]|uniref:Glucokinase n=1 Tax=Rubripirellula amarantea TaxID=2527999 RepID=A0A5C5WHC6_9BACT|nr:ROK family protein [Rubripirellula amarantea]MDA8743244.1 ROK family protein [Rubripirellula amarantea]TWT49509.1 Glucokinase [Rubripirellula amarantea]